jgi:hypothetical protein
MYIYIYIYKSLKLLTKHNFWFYIILHYFDLVKIKIKI